MASAGVLFDNIAKMMRRVRSLTPTGYNEDLLLPVSRAQSSMPASPGRKKKGVAG